MNVHTCTAHPSTHVYTSVSVCLCAYLSSLYLLLEPTSPYGQLLLQANITWLIFTSSFQYLCPSFMSVRNLVPIIPSIFSYLTNFLVYNYLLSPWAVFLAQYHVLRLVNDIPDPLVRVSLDAVKTV